MSVQGEGSGKGRPTSGPLGISKKDPQVRRRELLGSGGSSSLAAALVQLCTQRAPQLIRSQHGSDILVEVCRGGEGGLLEECLEGASAGIQEVHDALVAAAAGTASACGDENDEDEEAAASEQDPVLSHYFGSRALRRLVLAAGEGGAAAAACTRKLWSGALQGRCKDWVDTHAAKVLAALMHCGDAATQAAVAKELKPLVQGSLEEWAARLIAKQQPQQPQRPATKQQQQKRKQKKQ